jgi:hypothetical protein
MGCRNYFRFLNKVFWIQNQRVQILLNWSHTEINLNKLFEDFSILQLFQNWLEYSNSNQGFKHKTFKSIQKKILKLNLNLFEKRNPPKAHKKYACHAMQPLKLFKLSYCYFGENALSWEILNLSENQGVTHDNQAKYVKMVAPQKSVPGSNHKRF